MQVRNFKPRDLFSINKWLKLHKKKPVTFAELPIVGFVVPGVAIGFIRACEGGVGIFESLVSNPRASSATRHAAMSSIYDKVMACSEFERIIGFSIDSGALCRASNAGWLTLPYTLVSWERK